MDSSPKKGAASAARMGGRGVLRPRGVEKEDSLPSVTDGMVSSVKKDWEGPIGVGGVAREKSSSVSKA